jgi:NAD(P)-dependent dehydrogenase (short-subunit alcohol dehydrogenase family)
MAGMLYSMSKASSIQLTKMLSTHLSPISKVVCNAIAPGLFPSELTASGSDGKNESHLSQDDGTFALSLR